MDLTILEMGSAKERGIGEWEALFRQANESFIFKGGGRLEGSVLPILEAEWEE